MPYKAATVPVSACRLVSDESLITMANCEIKLFLKVHNNEIFRMFVDRFWPQKWMSGAAMKDRQLKRTNFNRILLLNEKLIVRVVNHENVKHKFNDVLLFVAGD